MGAFFIASMSMFTSCKDYDDDINAVQSDVDNLKKQVADLEAFKTKVEGEITQINSQLALKLDKGATKYTDAKQIEDAIANNADAIATKLDNGGSKYVDAKQIEDDIAKLSALFAKYATLEALDNAIAEVKALIPNDYVTKEELQQAINSISAIDPALINEAIAKVDGISTVANDAKAGADAALKQLEEQKALIEGLQKAIEGIVVNPDGKVDLTAYLKTEDLGKYLGDYAKTADLDQKFADILAKIPSEEKLKNDIVATLESKLTSLNTLQTDVQNIQNQIKNFDFGSTSTDIATLKNFMNSIDNKIVTVMTANASVLTVYVASSLTSLVLQPKFYLNGIEAVGVPMLVYQPVLQIANGDYRERGNAEERWIPVPKDVVTTEDIHWPEGMNLIATALTGGLDYNTLGYKFYQNFPNVHAYYHVNPENSELQGTNVKLYFNTPEVTETRATSYIDQYAIVPTPVESTISAATAAKAKATGIWDLEFQVPTQQFVNTYVKSFVDAWDAKRGYGVYETTRRIPFVAAALTQNVEGTARTVSSDWAALTPWLLHINALADNAPDIELARSWGDVDQNMVTRNHLYPSAKEAIEGEATHEVVYDGSIDLAPFIETHFSYVATAYNKDQIMPQELMDAMGLYYDYVLVDYTSNHYETSESHHAQLDGSVLYPRSVTDHGETILDKVATKEVVDREPLVRVELRAKKPGLHGAPATTLEEGEILKVGYIKLRIVETKSETMSVAIDFEDPIYMNCPGVGFLTWAQIENKILAAVEAQGLPKFDFDTEYRLEINNMYAPADNGGAVRYIELDGRFMNEADYIKYLEKKYKTDANFMIEDLVNKNIEFAHEYFKAFAGKINYTNEPSSLFPNDWHRKQTNVIYWILGADHSAHAHSYMEGSTIPSYVDQAYTTYLAQPDADGVSTKDITTIIRFNHIAKSNKSIFVKLRIPAGNLRYATAYLDNKNFHQWYQLNSKTSATSNIDAREVHVNPEVPRLADGKLSAYTELKQKDYAVNLMQFFSPSNDGAKRHFVKFTLNEPDNFYRFADINNGDDQEHVWFMLTTPNVAKGNIQNAANNAKLENIVVDGVTQPAMTWTVKGYSGATYKLAVANKLSSGKYVTSGILNVVDTREIYEHKNLDQEIVALERGNYIINIADDGTATPIVSLLDRRDNIAVDEWDTPTLDQVGDMDVNNEYIRFQENEIAEDILNYKTLVPTNYADRSKGFDKEIGEKEMFSAYLEVVYNGACYELYDKYNDIHNTAYFNVRFMRPINFYPLPVDAFVDASNSGCYIDFMDFLEWNSNSNKHYKKNANTVYAASDWRSFNMIRDNGTSHATYNGGNAAPSPLYNRDKVIIPATGENLVLWGYYRLYLNSDGDTHPGKLFADYNHTGNRQSVYKFNEKLISLIRTDATLPESQRSIIYPTTPENRQKIHELPLAGARKYFADVVDDGRGTAGLKLELGNNVAADKDGLLHYSNNEGTTQTFHLYVPIYYYYVFGESDYWLFNAGHPQDISMSPWYGSASGFDYFNYGEPFDAPATTYGVITVNVTEKGW